MRHRSPPPLPKALVFEDVSLSYGPVEAVRGVSLEVRRPEVVCLLGPSGCGKTSLLRLAAGIERARQGRASPSTGGMCASPSVFVPPERRGIGSSSRTMPCSRISPFSDNVKFGLARLPRSAAETEALRALSRVGLDTHAGAYPHELSAASSSASRLPARWRRDPASLLLDEPFSGLDRRAARPGP